MRIELGEIEAQLARHPALSAVAVTTTIPEDRPEERRLVAHVVPTPDHEVTPRGLRTFLLETLPDYLVPSLFLTREALPLLVSGKVDRAALELAARSTTALDGIAYGSGVPRNPIEELLVEIWQALLKVEQIATDDNFFALGGHSLLATQVIARLRQVFAVEVPLPSLFEGPTIAELAVVIEGLRGMDATAALPPLLPIERDRDLPLSFAQERLWFIDQLEPGNPVYHLPLILRFRGALDVTALGASLAELERRHEVLRTRFAALQGEPIQVIDPPAPPVLPVVDLSALPAAARQETLNRWIWDEARRPFDLAHGPLWRRTLLRLSGSESVEPATERHVALVSFHHIAADGWSMGVFLAEMGALYRAFASRPSPRLPELEVQYADFALWQRQWLQGDFSVTIPAGGRILVLHFAAQASDRGTALTRAADLESLSLDATDGLSAEELADIVNF